MCDHIIFYDNGTFVNEKDILGYLKYHINRINYFNSQFKNNIPITKITYLKYNKGNSMQFKYCPNCGKKINWNEIEKLCK